MKVARLRWADNRFNVSGRRPRPDELIQRDRAGASIGTSAYSLIHFASMQASFSQRLEATTVEMT